MKIVCKQTSLQMQRVKIFGKISPWPIVFATIYGTLIDVTQSRSMHFSQNDIVRISFSL